MPRRVVGPDDVRRGHHPDAGLHRLIDQQIGRVTPKTFSASQPTEIDLIAVLLGDPNAYPVKNQGQSNFCVRFARCSALELLAMLGPDGKRDPAATLVPLSPLFAAWDDAMDGDQGKNRGTQVYLSAEAAARVGTCLNASHPWEKDAAGDYLTRMAIRPPDFAYREAERHQGPKSYRLPDGADSVPAILEAHARLLPAQIAVPLRQGFWDSLNAGKMIDNRGGITGYHSMCSVGVVKFNGVWCLKILNSWDKDTGVEGYVYWPLDGFTENSDGRVYTQVEIVR